MGSPMYTNSAIIAKSAEKWRAMAKEAVEKEYESFERCDTEGFLSQACWSFQRFACLDAAKIVENGGYWTFSQVYDLNGNPVNAKPCNTRYGFAYRIEHDNGDVEWFRPSEAQNETVRIRNNAKKGYFIGKVEMPAMICYGAGFKHTIEPDRYAEGKPRYTVTRALL